MATATIAHEPIVRGPAGRAGRRVENGCECRARALEELGGLAELTLSLGIHDLAVWRGLTRLEVHLASEPLSRHRHAPGDVHERQPGPVHGGAWAARTERIADDPTAPDPYADDRRRRKMATSARATGAQGRATPPAPRKTKLTAAAVDAIRRSWRPGVRGRGERSLARRFGVSPATVRRVLLGVTWKASGGLPAAPRWPGARISRGMAGEIRRLAASGRWSTRRLALRAHLGRREVQRILRGERWKEEPA